MRRASNSSWSCDFTSDDWAAGNFGVQPGCFQAAKTYYTGSSRRQSYIHQLQNGVSGVSLESEIDSSSGHSEIVVASIHNAPTEVVDQPDMASKAKLEASAELADRFAFAAADVCAKRIRSGRRSQRIDEFEAQVLCSTRNEASARENVRGEAGSTNWVAKSNRRQPGPDGARIVQGLVGGAVAGKEGDVGECGCARHSVALDPDRNMTVEEVFCIEPSAPRVIRFQEPILTVLVGGRQVCPPELNIEFPSSIPARLIRRRYAFIKSLRRAAEASGGEENQEGNAGEECFHGSPPQQARGEP